MPGADDTNTLTESVRISDADRSSLASKIQSGFDSVMSTDDGTPDAGEQESAETAKMADGESGEAEQPADAAAETAELPTGDEPADSATTEQQAEAAAPSNAAPTLPAAYVRSLKAMEWTDEEIAQAAKNPSFITTAAKLHATRNKEVQAWADLGRKQKEAQAAASKDAQPFPTNGLQAIDAKTLKDKYGDEPIIDAIVGPVNDVIQRINAVLPAVQQTHTQAQQAQAEHLARQIDGFFGGKELVAYKDVYGTDAAKLTEPQVQARQKVLELADALVGGAAQQGKRLSVDEALTLAHDAISGGTKEQAARKQITQQLQTRQKGITLKPGSRGTSNLGNSARPKSRGEFESRVKSGLAAAFGGR